MVDDIFIQQLFSRHRSTISRAITIVEEEGDEAGELINRIQGRTGYTYRIGITGPPGAGKSTITNHLVRKYRQRRKTVGVIAVDPTSPFTSGALLGDRVRMSDVCDDDGVYIRSMASRGSLGGLGRRTGDAADIIAAAGYDYLLIETVGIGQSELDIAQAADTTVVVLVPESGDTVQMMKAGLMEIADVFVLNKADRPESDATYGAISATLTLGCRDQGEWMPALIKAIAIRDEGIDGIADSIERHRDFLQAGDGLHRKQEQRMMNRIRDMVECSVRSGLWNERRIAEIKNAVKDIVSGKTTPAELAQNIMDDYLQEREKSGNKTW